MASNGTLSCGEITCEALLEDLTAIHYTKLVSGTSSLHQGRLSAYKLLLLVSAYTILLYDYSEYLSDIEAQHDLTPSSQ